jgi:hypothetical protein
MNSTGPGPGQVSGFLFYYKPIMPRTKPITVGEFIEHLIDIQAKHGILASTPIAYSHDDEGNQLQYATQLPTLMFSKTPAKY